MEVKAMNLTICNLAQKLVSFEHIIEGGKFDIVYASAESATDVISTITEEEHYFQ